MNEPARAVLVIGGHDSSGQAGVEVDRSAVESLDLEARVVVSAWTQQGSMGVTEIGAVDPSLWLAEALSLLDEQVGAVKFGLLPGLAAARAAGSLMQEVAPGLPVVLDPVIAASSGERFLDHAIVEGYCEQLLSLGAIWTPNLPELAELCDVDLGLLESDLEARSAAAERLVAAGARAVLVKGGHGVESPVQDLVLERGVRPYWSRRERLEGRSLRGTGCRYASSLAGRLALGFSLPQAAQEAGEWVAGCIERGG